MISPEKFYGAMTEPSGTLQRKMWSSIKQSIDRSPKTGLLGFERRSFIYGAVASLVFMFTCVGIYSTLSGLIDSSKPPSIRLDSAYESAIRQFERFVPVSSAVAVEQKDVISSRKDQLKYFDAAIDAMKKEMNGSDLSPVKRARLRQLYSMKLAVLQEMIERGEVDL